MTGLGLDIVPRTWNALAEARDRVRSENLISLFTQPARNRGSTLWVPKTRPRSCNHAVFVDEAAQDVARWRRFFGVTRLSLMPLSWASRTRRWGNRLAAFVVSEPGSSLSTDEVREYVRSRLARFKIPRYVEFVDEIPRNSMGKALLRVLLERSAFDSKR